MKKNRITFKTDKPTGQWRSFENDYHHIKLNGKKVGSIDDKAPHHIRFMRIKNDIMEDGNQNCIWHWIRLKKDSETLQEAKDFVIENIDLILSLYNIYQMEE